MPRYDAGAQANADVRGGGGAGPSITCPSHQSENRRIQLHRLVSSRKIQLRRLVSAGPTKKLDGRGAHPLQNCPKRGQQERCPRQAWLQKTILRWQVLTDRFLMRKEGRKLRALALQKAAAECI